MRQYAHAEVVREIGCLRCFYLGSMLLDATAIKSKQVRLTRRSPTYWQVTFDNPPLNIFGPEAILEMKAIMAALEADEQAKVVVFDSAVKRLVNANSLAPDVEIGAGWDACINSIARPAAQERIKRLIERGFHKPGDVEDRLGYYVGQL